MDSWNTEKKTGWEEEESDAHQPSVAVGVLTG